MQNLRLYFVDLQGDGTSTSCPNRIQIECACCWWVNTCPSFRYIYFRKLLGNAESLFLIIRRYCVYQCFLMNVRFNYVSLLVLSWHLGEGVPCLQQGQILRAALSPKRNMKSWVHIGVDEGLCVADVTFTIFLMKKEVWVQDESGMIVYLKDREWD